MRGDNWEQVKARAKKRRSQKQRRWAIVLIGGFAVVVIAASLSQSTWVGGLVYVYGFVFWIGLFRLWRLRKRT